MWLAINREDSVERGRLGLAGIWQKVDYIHQNPVRAGWVDKAEEYLYSSARNYVFENEGCLLELDLLEPYLPGSSFVYLPGFDDQL